MIVALFPGGHIDLDDCHNFRTFRVDVVAPRADFDVIRTEWPELVTFSDSDVAWVSISYLSALKSVRDDPAWQAGLAAMVAAARPHGWIDAGGISIRAHVTWFNPATETLSGHENGRCKIEAG